MGHTGPWGVRLTYLLREERIEGNAREPLSVHPAGTRVLVGLADSCDARIAWILRFRPLILVGAEGDGLFCGTALAMIRGSSEDSMILRTPHKAINLAFVYATVLLTVLAPVRFAGGGPGSSCQQGSASRSAACCCCDGIQQAPDGCHSRVSTQQCSCLHPEELPNSQQTGSARSERLPEGGDAFWQKTLRLRSFDPARFRSSRIGVPGIAGSPPAGQSIQILFCSLLS